MADDVPGVTDGRRLSAILSKSLEVEPRNYVLIGIRSKQCMRASAYGQALGEMFKPKKPLQNLLRKAYVNHTHRMKINGMELPESKLKAIADRMRHTVEVARGSYRKVNLSLPEDAEVKADWAPGELPPHPPAPPIFADDAPPIAPPIAHFSLPSAPPVLAARHTSTRPNIPGPTGSPIPKTSAERRKRDMPPTSTRSFGPSSLAISITA